MRRGELYRVCRPGADPKRYRSFVVVSRQVLIDSRFSTVICAPVFTSGEGLSTQVAIGPDPNQRLFVACGCDSLRHRRSRQSVVRREQQCEQGSTDKDEIPKDGHWPRSARRIPAWALRLNRRSFN